MKPSSAKNKGRKLQQDVVKKILETFPQLEKDDVTSRSMGAAGEDVLLSPKAREYFPFSVECKSMARSTVYKYFDQAKENAGTYFPLVVLKANNRKPLVIMDLDEFMRFV